MSIKIKEFNRALTETELKNHEDQGLTLIAVNTHTTEEFAVPVSMWCPGMDCGIKRIDHWTYHFRTTAEFNESEYFRTTKE